MNTVFEVIRFELLRNIKKPAFWIAAILLPVIFGIYIGIAALAGVSAENAMNNQSMDIAEKTIGYYDASSYIESPIYSDSEGKNHEAIAYSDKEAGIEDIKSDKLDLFYFVPSDFGKGGNVEIYSKTDSVNILEDNTFVITQLLNNTANSHVSELDLVVLNGLYSYNNIAYSTKDNHEIDTSEVVSNLAAPLIACILFYVLICMLGNRLIAAMVEEKENRISELLLTSIKPTSLIVGKTIAMMVLGIIQLLVVMIPIALLYFAGKNMGAIPLDIELNFSAYDIIRYTCVLLISYFFFAAGCILVGTITDTAKDANSFSGVIILPLILPMIFMSCFMEGGNVVMSNAMTFIPFTAPLSIMIRGICGTIADWQFWLATAELLVSGSLIAWHATYIFKHNALSFSSKINFKKLLGKPRKSWK